MIRRAQAQDLDTIASLAVMLWPNHSIRELTDDISAVLSSGRGQFFLKYEAGEPVGFAQCQLRHDYVEGTQTSPVGYLEGIFVKEGCRKKGYAGELLAACEAWARACGCREFASDCEVENTESIRFHRAMHFTEANRIVCFTKPL